MRQLFSTNHVAVVVGAGVSGQAATRLLHLCGATARLVERNAERIPADFADWAADAGVEILTGEHTAEQFADATVVIPSPGAAASSLRALLPAHNTPEIMAETELAWRALHDENGQINEKVLAITGTSGKTTTTSLCAAMLMEQGLTVFTGGNIGTPLSTYVLNREHGAPQADVLVLELSSFQLQTCSTFRPDIAVLLNISENHLDYHADMNEYIAAKMQIFAKQTAADRAVLQEGMNTLAKTFRVAAHCVTYRPCERFAHMQLFGEHNQANAEAAWTACSALGVTEAAACRAVASFAPIEHRLERVEEVNGVLFVNDSKATTVEALRGALSAFDRPVLLLAGGKFKGGDLNSLQTLIATKVRHIALFGGYRDAFTAAWQTVAPITWDETLQQALLRLAGTKGLARPGDVVLLAPATASFDQYPSYQHRGEDFKRIVREELPRTQS